MKYWCDNQEPSEKLRTSLAWLKQANNQSTRMPQQLDAMVSTMTKRSSKPEATATAYQFSPQHTTALDNKVIHLEGKIDQQVRMVGNRPQESSSSTQSADEELRYLQEQVRQKRGINIEEHFNAIAANQPSTSERNHSCSESEELQRLREENRFLRTSQRGPQQPQQFQNRMNYDSQDAFQERMKNEMHRMQAGLDGGYENPCQ